MADYDLKSISADGSFADGNLLAGADDQSSATPKLYTSAGIKAWIQSFFGTAAANNSATVGEILAGTADKVVESDTLLAAMAGVALTDGANIAVDLATGVYFTVTLGGNRTLDNPSNHKVGRTIYVKITQDGTGSRTLAYGNQYDFGQDSAPTLSTAAGTVDLLAFFVSTTSKLVYLGIRKDIG
jgi:hypothetical protein